MSDSSRSTEQFILDMAEEIPALGRLLDQHLVTNDGDLLSTIFLGEVGLWFTEAALHGDQPTCERVASMIEDGVASSPRVADTVAVGFLEALPSPGTPAFNIVHGLLPAQLREQYDTMVQ
jgi:hypothetical protein